MKSIKNTRYFDLGYRTGYTEAAELPENHIRTMLNAMQHIIERETVEPDHPGNIHPHDISMIAGRAAAYRQMIRERYTVKETA